MALANGLAGALPLRANLESFCYVKGISMFSNQSQNEMVYTESAKECWELCTVYEECKNWTFHYDNHGHSNVRGHKNGTHKCLLITSDDAPVISEDSNAVSGSHMCGDNDCMMSAVEFQGADQDLDPKFKKFTAAVEGCQWICDMIPECMLYDWNENTNECRLKNSGAKAYVSTTSTAGSHNC
ncbi:Oidioi.mRNA.OKI2018_I69.chr1.g3442.t1.cds [Oikopleura dioica]|uniref:Oidioi.mRNA.OKI2018_I69.chr1.g3442.t1.cds n=1 Tax=Oikopleura dioica TaxID=34765 RepID=A0ABN7SZJ5_OIKDI|nr:Oidioi.mRNA.OKI2018_I69.chr1.g3442.t1.cds [Oikopleura dioica]